MRYKSTITLSVCMTILAFSLAAIEPMASEEKTLYEKIAFSSLAIHGIIIAADAKYAEIHVLEVLKGGFSEEMLNVSFRLDNFGRQRGEEKIVFTNGEEAILLLEPLLTRSGRIKDPSLFKLKNKAEGKIEVSPESGHLLIEAVKRFIRIQSLGSQERIWQEHRSLILKKNRYLIRAGFQEILKFRIGDWSQIPTLLQFLLSQDSEFKISSLKVIAQIFEDHRKTTKEKEGREEVIRTLIRMIRGDDEPAARVEAIRALSASGAEKHQDLLEAISDDDESQLVRYEAQKVLYEIEAKKQSQ